MNFSRKMLVMIILKVTKKEGFILSLADTFSMKLTFYKIAHTLKFQSAKIARAVSIFGQIKHMRI